MFTSSLLPFGWQQGRTTFSTENNQKMASNDPSRLISPLVNLSRGNPRGGEIRPCVTKAVNATVFPKQRNRFADLSDTAKYPFFRASALKFPISPRVRRQPRADLLGVHTRTDAWDWVIKQIKENLRNNIWMHANRLQAVADISTRVSPRMGNCRFPSFATPCMAREWLGIWRLTSTRRARRNNWPLPSPIFGRDGYTSRPAYFPGCGRKEFGSRSPRTTHGQ